MTTTTSDYLDDFNKTITTIYVFLSPYTQGQRNIIIYVQYIQYKIIGRRVEYFYKDVEKCLSIHFVNTLNVFSHFVSTVCQRI
jgi:hypothetical protein